MSIEKYVKRQRKDKYKNLRKVRKARDMVSSATQNKKGALKLSRLVERLNADISTITTKELARLIYHQMPKYLWATISRPVRERIGNACSELYDERKRQDNSHINTTKRYRNRAQCLICNHTASVIYDKKEDYQEVSVCPKCKGAFVDTWKISKYLNS